MIAFLTSTHGIVSFKNQKTRQQEGGYKKEPNLLGDCIGTKRTLLHIPMRRRRRPIGRPSHPAATLPSAVTLPRRQAHHPTGSLLVAGASRERRLRARIEVLVVGGRGVVGGDAGSTAAEIAGVEYWPWDVAEKVGGSHLRRRRRVAGDVGLMHARGPQI